MIMNLRQLKDIVNARVLGDVDHKNLNADVAWMKDAIPTTEIFAERLWQRLADVLAREAPRVQLVGLVLHETPNNKVSITRGRA
jgi:6-pyruvoyl-tetrahydropterin synthase